MYFSAEPIGFSCKEPDFCEDNPNPCIVVIVSGSVAITYKTHSNYISQPYNVIESLHGGNYYII